MKSNIFVTFVFLLAGITASAQPIPGVLHSNFDLAKVPPKQAPRLVQTITIDTRQPQTCKETRALLDPSGKNKRFDDLCAPNKEQPYSTVFIVNPPTEEASGILYTLNEDDMVHANNGRNVVILGVFTVGRFLAKGYEESSWENPGKDPGRAYYNHITRAPVIDKDSFRTNFIEHPISGAVYYSIARHSGFSALESFGFSVISSTFLWEYGLEAIFERPSINDLIVTPVLGSLLGELLYQLSEKISNNDGKVLGSRKLGLVAQMIVSPGVGLSAMLNYVLGAEWFKSGDIGWVVTNPSRRPGIVPLTYQDTFEPRQLALRFRLKF